MVEKTKINRRSGNEVDRRELLSHKHIILAVDHNNSLGMVRSLGEIGINPIILMVSEEKSRQVENCRYAKMITYFSKINEAISFLIEKYGNEELKPFLYNGNDNIAVALDDRYAELEGKFYFFNAKGNLKKYLQKYDITLVASECGCKIPREELCVRGELPQQLNYPVITKADTSANGGDWKMDSYICENQEELVEAYKQIKSDTVLVQEYIRKKNEYCIDGISINAGEQVYMPYAAQYFRFPKDSFGAYMWFEPVVNEQLIENITKIIRKTKYTGIFCVEFLIGPDDEYYFLEVNYRNSGWSYAFTYGGFNLLYMWAKSTLENKINLSNFKQLKHFTAMAELEDFSMNVTKGKISIFRWIKDFVNADCKFLYNPTDKKPFVDIAVNYVPTLVRRKLTYVLEKIRGR